MQQLREANSRRGAFGLLKLLGGEARELPPVLVLQPRTLSIPEVWRGEARACTAAAAAAIAGGARGFSLLSDDMGNGRGVEERGVVGVADIAESCQQYQMRSEGTLSLLSEHLLHGSLN